MCMNDETHKYTTQLPTEIGWYWLYISNIDVEVICRVDRNIFDGHMICSWVNERGEPISATIDHWNHTQWCGPLRSPGHITTRSK